MCGKEKLREEKEGNAARRKMRKMVKKANRVQMAKKGSEERDHSNVI